MDVGGVGCICMRREHLPSRPRHAVSRVHDATTRGYPVLPPGIYERSNSADPRRTTPRRAPSHGRCRTTRGHRRTELAPLFPPFFPAPPHATAYPRPSSLLPITT